MTNKLSHFCAFIGVSLLTVFASAQARRATLIAHHVPAAVKSAPLVAPLPGERHLQLAFSLPLRNQDELNKLLVDIQDPTSPQYHKYLTSKEFDDRFGPSQEDYDKAVKWATDNGMTVTNKVASRTLVDVDASVDTINSALHVTMNSYQHPSENRAFFSADKEPTVDLKVQLLQVSGLDNFSLPHSHLKNHNPSTTESAPTSKITHGSLNHGATYSTSDIRKAYYGTGNLDGSGQSIAIFSFEGYLDYDLKQFLSLDGQPATAFDKVVRINVGGFDGTCFDSNKYHAPGVPTNTDPTTPAGKKQVKASGCDDGEQILDIGNAIGMAPGTDHIYFYEGASAVDVLEQMASDKLAKSISSSWSGGDFGKQAINPHLIKMALQGQTFFNATGDDGAFEYHVKGKNPDGDSVDDDTYGVPSVNPYMVQVGGTSLVTDVDGTWASETAWTNSGGGFIPKGEPLPDWQPASIMTASNSGSTKYRNSPDVAMEAYWDNLTYSAGKAIYDVGGTSYAAPRWAGYIALANQEAASAGKHPVGFINTSLYQIGARVWPSLPGTVFYDNPYFHDITSGSNGPLEAYPRNWGYDVKIQYLGPSWDPTTDGYPALYEGFSAAVGYDLVTGWGSPNGDALIKKLAGTTTRPYSGSEDF